MPGCIVAEPGVETSGEMDMTERDEKGTRAPTSERRREWVPELLPLVVGEGTGDHEPSCDIGVRPNADAARLGGRLARR